MNRIRTAAMTAMIATLAMTASVALADSQIDSCGRVITEPGNYRLSSDLLSCGGVGIFIVSSDVSLNMKGHSISCDRVDGRLDVAVGILNVDNVSVTNGRVEYCDAGILLEQATDSKITNMRAVRNDTADKFLGGGFGIFAGNTVRTKIRGNHLSENIVGLRLTGYQNKIVGNVSTGNVRNDENAPFPTFGIGIGLDGDQNVVTGNTTTNNSDTGIALTNGARDNVVRGNIANSNGVYGIGMFSREDLGWPLAFENLIQSNTALGNGRADLLEAKFDPFENPREDIQDQCVNEWIDNEFVTTLGPDDCLN